MKNVWLLAHAALALTLGTGCLESHPEKPLPPIREAYLLMDKGENGKAILLLEDATDRNPENAEIRLLLASAYAGEAGIDVYSLHDSFQDILFKKPLSGKFWSDPDGPEATPAAPAPRAPVSADSPELKREPTRVERLIRQLDSFLGDVHRATIILERFPEITRERWPLLDRSLGILDELTPDKDIALYRAFLRINYIKTFINKELFGNHRAGSREWACSIEFPAFRENLTWLLSHTTATSNDLAIAFPKKSVTLLNLKDSLEALIEELDQTQELSQAAPRTAATMNVLESNIREYFNCVIDK